MGALAARAWVMEGTTLELNLSRVYSALPGALVLWRRSSAPALCRSSESPGPFQSPTATSSYSLSFLSACVHVTSPPGSFPPVLAAPSRSPCRGTSVPPAPIKPSRVFADIHYGPQAAIYGGCAQKRSHFKTSPHRPPRHGHFRSRLLRGNAYPRPQPSRRRYSLSQ